MRHCSHPHTIVDRSSFADIGPGLWISYIYKNENHRLVLNLFSPHPSCRRKRRGILATLDLVHTHTHTRIRANSLCLSPSPYLACPLNRVIRRSLYSAQARPILLPPLAADAREAPKHIIRIHAALDLQESRVVVSPERLLPVGLVSRCLSHGGMRVSSPFRIDKAMEGHDLPRSRMRQNWGRFLARTMTEIAWP